MFRQPRPVAYYQQVAKEAQDEARSLRVEVQQLRAERGVPDGLRGAIASGLVAGGRGVAVKDLSNDVTEKEGNALAKDRVASYRARRVAVEVYFS